jgi:hypothetical protein
LAIKQDINSDLTLEIDGRSVTPDKFLRSVRAFFSILSEVTNKFAGPTGGVRWKVKVKEGSNLVGVVPEPGFSPAAVSEIIAAVSQGLDQIENSGAQPKHFSERAIKSLKELADVVGTTESDDTFIRVWARKEPLKITHKSTAHIAELLASEHEDYGSIEGKLRTVSDKGGLHFIVEEPLRKQTVRCYIPDQLIETAMANFRNRVEVYGRIKYRKDGKAVSIDVDDIVQFPQKASIPSFRDVHGVLREAS